MTARKPQRARQLGISDEDYARMLAAQHGSCALCPSRPKSRRFSVDHDHATGAVRGLLCHRCNRNLPTWVTTGWLQRAIAYLDNGNDTAAELRALAPAHAALVDAGATITLHGNAATTGNNRRRT